MRFLRENLFLVILAVVVLLGGGALMAGYLRLAKGVDAAVADRSQLADNLNRLAGGGGANAAMVAAAEEKAQQIQKAVAEVANTNIEWNRKNLQVFQLPGELGEPIAAFPIDEAVYRDEALDYTFTRVYLEEMSKLLASLKPTTAPTEGEIESQAIQWETRLALQRQAEEAKMRGAGLQAVTPAPGQTAESVLPSASPYASTGGASSGASEEAREKGRRTAMISKARAGMIYAGPESLDMYFLEEVRNRPFSELWQAQLNYWVTSEVIRAINQTNQEVLAKLPVSERNVLAAPVKHLVRIEVNENYVQAAPEQAAPAARSVRPEGREFYEEIEETETMTEGQATAGPGEKPNASPLTNRGSNKNYDVLQYSFIVVARPEHLATLQRNLLAGNYHTVLSIQLEAVGETGPAPSTEGSGATFNIPDAGAAGVSSNLFYYGPQMVVQARIECELLLLTQWERGTRDAANNRWVEMFPPLIPVDALTQQFPGADNPALRPEDIARLPQQQPAATEEGAEAPPPSSEAL